MPKSKGTIRQVNFLEGSGTNINTTISQASRTTKHANESKEHSLPDPGKGGFFTLLSFSCFVALEAREMVVFMCVPEPSKKCT